MRIAFVSLMAGSPWAASEVLWAEAAELALKQGHEVLISTLGWQERPPRLAELGARGARIETRPVSRWIRRSALLSTLGRPFGSLHAFKPDVICISQGGTYDIGKSGATTVLRHTLRRTRAPYILLCHCEQPTPPARTLRRALGVFRRATVVGMVASRLREVSQAQFGAALDNVRVFHNPVNLRRIEYLPWPEGDVVRFAALGRLDPVKNIGALIEAFCDSEWMSRSWTLTIYGAGPERPHLEEQVRNKSLSGRIRFAGYVDDIAGVWATHHVLIMPSIFEGVPLAMIEAMLCGRPVIATDVGGTAEWIEEGQTGFLISRPTPAEIQRTLTRAWLQRDRLQELGKGAHERTLAKRDPNPSGTLLNWMQVAALESESLMGGRRQRGLCEAAQVAATPRIEAIPRETLGARPRISVVIPTFNPEPFLCDTIKSVLAQDRGGAEMQIAIVDDGSRRRSARQLTESIAPPGRIEIHEHENNLGLAGNWNRAISLARGQFVHVLHQDDVVRPGFYDTLIAGLTSQPQIGMAFCRHAYTDEHDVVHRVSHRERWRAGILPDWLDRIAEGQRIQCPSAIVKREVYEQVGGFRPELRYALDWEMWVRIAARFDVWYEPAVLAHYRRHKRAESARLEVSGLINDDLMNAIELFSTYLPCEDRHRLKARAYRNLARLQLRRASKLLARRYPQGAADQVDCARAALARSPEDFANRWARLKLGRLESQLSNRAGHVG